LILQKLRVDGYCGEIKFFVESIREFYLQNELNQNIDFQRLQIKNEERGWVASDISEAVCTFLTGINLNSFQHPQSYQLPAQTNEFIISPLTIAAYLRIFDEIHYGNCNWKLIGKIIQLVKFYSHGRYGLNNNGADFLLFFILCSIKTEEIGEPKLTDGFRFDNGIRQSLGEQIA
jgi:hypothetical protein